MLKDKQEVCWNSSWKPGNFGESNFLKVIKFTAVPIVINPIFMPPTNHHTCDNPVSETAGFQALTTCLDLTQDRSQPEYT